MSKKLFKNQDHAKQAKFYNHAGVTKEQLDAHWMPFSGAFSCSGRDSVRVNIELSVV